MSAPATHVAAEVAPIVNSLLCFIPLCPLIGAAVVYLFTRKWQAFSGWVASLAAFVSFLVTVQLFRGLPAESGSSITAHAWHWIQAGSFSADLAFRMDHLSAVMTLVVTGVGTLIHLYAIGYMAEDESGRGSLRI
jgi:NADH-quinone oxidoreductase subunit L